MTDSIVHIAGHPVQVGSHIRQRCAWCGAVLIDQDLTRIAVPVGQEGDYPTWATGELIEINGLDDSAVSAAWVVEHADGEPVPEGCCAKLGPEVTA